VFFCKISAAFPSLLLKASVLTLAKDIAEIAVRVSNKAISLDFDIMASFPFAYCFVMENIR
jgi:hypothetical protein